jgi:hypothetical protein
MAVTKSKLNNKSETRIRITCGLLSLNFKLENLSANKGISETNKADIVMTKNKSTK